MKEVLGYSYEDVKEWDGDIIKMVFKDDVDTVKKEFAKYSELEDESSHSSLDETAKKKLKLQSWINYFAVEVEDNGIGFEKQYSSTIFKIFQRLHGKSEYPGSGFGLAICKKIVDHHKGVIYAESERSKGSKFTFILPEKQYG